MDKLRVVFFGTPDFVIPVLEKLHQEFLVVGVITTPDQKAGRKQLLTASPVKKAAEALSIPAILTLDTFAGQTFQALQNLTPDLFVVAAFGKIIPKTVLTIPRFGAVNIHPSLLPTYRGPSPIQATILNGDTKTGITIIMMDQEVDHGPILATKTHELSGNETFLSLAQTLFHLGAEMLPKVIADYVKGALQPFEQNHTQATFTNHLEKQNGYFDIKNPPEKEVLDRMIRAYFPWPTVWTRIPTKQGEKILKLLPEKKIRLEGKNTLSIKDFANGYPELRGILEQVI